MVLQDRVRKRVCCSVSLSPAACVYEAMLCKRSSFTFFFLVSFFIQFRYSFSTALVCHSHGVFPFISSLAGGNIARPNCFVHLIEALFNVDGGSRFILYIYVYTCVRIAGMKPKAERNRRGGVYWISLRTQPKLNQAGRAVRSFVRPVPSNLMRFSQETETVWKFCFRLN